MQPSLDTTITLQQIYMNMAGGAAFISVDSPMVRDFTKLLLAMNTIWHTLWASGTV